MLSTRVLVMSALTACFMLFALISTADIAFAAEKNAVRAEKPVLVPHTKFVFKFTGKSGTYSTEYIKNDGGILIFDVTHRSGQLETYRATEDLEGISNTRTDGTIRRSFTPHSGFLSFPLYVGKKWEAKYTLTSNKYTGEQTKIQRKRTCEVDDYEKTEVKAGTFDSFIIRCENQRDGRSLPAYERYAYAPTVGQVVYYRSDEFKTEYELTEIVPASK